MTSLINFLLSIISLLDWSKSYYNDFVAFSITKSIRDVGYAFLFNINAIIRFHS
jgi:hypothetical protein